MRFYVSSLVTHLLCAGMVLIAACDRTTSSNPSSPDSSPQPSPVEQSDWAQTFLQVMPLYGVANQPITVTFDLYGPDGCYRQSSATTHIQDKRILHRYRTWSEGDFCTEALVPGGFSTLVAPPVAGIYRGEVLRDETTVARYTLYLFPNRQLAAAELKQALPTLSPWELTQVVAQVTQNPDGDLEKALVKVLSPYIVEANPNDLWRAIATWLQQTPHLAVVQAARPALEQPSRSGIIPQAETKQTILVRLESL